MAYALDLTASLAANYITGNFPREDVNGNWLLIMVGGVFYTKDLVVRNAINNAELRPGVDYNVLHLNKEATMMAGGKETSTIVHITLASVTEVKVTRRVVGGKFETIGSDIRQIITDTDLDELNSTAWGQILGAPYQYPFKNHPHWEDEVYGLGNVQQGLTFIAEAIRSGDERLFGMIYQYIDRLSQETSKRIEQELEVIKEETENIKESTQVVPGMVVFFKDAVHPKDRFKFGTWRRLPEDTFLWAVDDAKLGIRKKVGEGPDYVSTGFAGWELVSL